MYTPLGLSDCKPEPSERLLLAASAIVMDDLDQFPDYQLDTLHLDWTCYCTPAIGEFIRVYGLTARSTRPICLVALVLLSRT